MVNLLSIKGELSGHKCSHSWCASFSILIMFTLKPPPHTHTLKKMFRATLNQMDLTSFYRVNLCIKEGAFSVSSAGICPHLTPL